MVAGARLASRGGVLREPLELLLRVLLELPQMRDRLLHGYGLLQTHRPHMLWSKSGEQRRLEADREAFDD